MAKKQTEIENKSQLFEMSVEEVMHTSMMPYSEYVILDRAIPRVDDGLKHRPEVGERPAKPDPAGGVFFVLRIEAVSLKLLAPERPHDAHAR